MTAEKLNNLRTACAGFLKANKLRPGTATGNKAIHIFWVGALHALNETSNPYVKLCLLSGRHDELIDK